MQIPDIDASNVTAALAGVGSLNWALLEYAQFDVVAELLGSSSPELGYLAFGVAGAISLTEQFELTEMFD